MNKNYIKFSTCTLVSLSSFTPPSYVRPIIRRTKARRTLCSARRSDLLKEKKVIKGLIRLGKKWTQTGQVECAYLKIQSSRTKEQVRYAQTTNSSSYKIRKESTSNTRPVKYITDEKTTMNSRRHIKILYSTDTYRQPIAIVLNKYAINPKNSTESRRSPLKQRIKKEGREKPYRTQIVNRCINKVDINLDATAHRALVKLDQNHSLKQLKYNRKRYGCNCPSTQNNKKYLNCLLYTSPSPRDRQKSRMPSSA